MPALLMSIPHDPFRIAIRSTRPFEGPKRYAPAALQKIEHMIAVTENPPPPEPLIEGRENIVIGEQGVVLLETSASRVGLGALENLVFGGFWGARDLRPPGTEWLAFKDSGRFHHQGKSDWIGLSANVPSSVVDAIQDSFEALGLDVERELGRALHLNLTPLARLCDDDLEILVPAALAGDPRRRRKVDRGEVSPIARGYVLNPT